VLAKPSNLAPSSVVLVSGAKNRRKIVAVGVDAAETVERWCANLDVDALTVLD